MPLRLTFKEHVILRDKVWGDKQEVDELSLENWREIFAEDLSGLSECIGGLENLIVNVDWVEEQAGTTAGGLSSDQAGMLRKELV